MTLLRDIQDAAMGDEALASLLRKCRVLAARLNHDPLAAWAERELNGYENAEDLPDFRKTSVSVRGHWMGPFGSEIKNGPIAPSQVNEAHREPLFSSKFFAGVGVYEDLLQRLEGDLTELWPQDIVIYYQDKFLANGMTLVSARKVVPRGAAVGMLEQVRNRILTFALEIERENPAAGEAPVGAEPIDQERVSSIFTTNIYGGTNVVASGSGNTISSPIQLVAGDRDALRRALAEIGIPDDELAQLDDALDADEGEATKPGRNVRDWLGNLQVKVLSGALAAVATTGATAATKLILAYYGLLP